MPKVQKTKFSQDEFYYLLSQFAPVAAIGWEDPYTGWLAEEVEAAQKKALNSLIDRELVLLVDEQEIALEENVAQVFTACAGPDFSLIIVSAKNKRTKQHVVHLKKDMIVQHSITKKTHTLTVLNSRSSLVDELIPVLVPETPAKSKVGPFQISESAFAECEALIKKKKVQEAKALLKTEKVDKKSSAALLDGISKPNLRAAIILVPSKDLDAVAAKSGIAVFQSEKHFWLLRPFDRAGKQYIEFVPGTVQLVAKELNQLFPQEVISRNGNS